MESSGTGEFILPWVIFSSHSNAIMIIKIAVLFKIADARWPEVDQGATVTGFNDMCFMAPVSLNSSDIQINM